MVRGEILKRWRIPEMAIVKKGEDVACPPGKDKLCRRRHPGGSRRACTAPGAWQPAQPGYSVHRTRSADPKCTPSPKLLR